MNELLKALAPAKRRLRIQRLLQGAGAGFAFGALAALVLLAVTSFVPLDGRWLIAGAAVAGCMLLGALGNAARPVNAREAARAADACGLRERSVTALELAGSPETEITRCQRQDACEHLRQLDVKQIPLRFPRRLAAIGAGLLVLCCATLLLPGSGDRAVAARKALDQKTASMEKAIDEAAKLEETGMDEKQKAELRKLTEDLKRELRASRDELDAMVALDKGEQRLEKLHGEQKTAGDAMNAMDALARAMENAGMDPVIAEAMSGAMTDGNAAAMSTALAQVNADQMKELAENLSGDAQALAEQLAEAAAQGEMTEAQMQALMSGMSGISAQGSPLQQALSGMKGSLGAMGQTGNQSGQGSGGQTAGNGPGKAGGGAGTGSTNQEQQGSGSAGNGPVKGNQPAAFKEREYETIYDPEKVDKASRDVMTEQNSLGKDSVQIETGPGKGTLEGDIPFREVVEEYAEQEAQAAESAHLTREQREWVDEYFRLLTDE